MLSLRCWSILEFASRLIHGVVLALCHRHRQQALAARRGLRGALLSAELLPGNLPIVVFIVEVSHHLLEEALDLVLVDKAVLIHVHVGKKDGKRRTILDIDVDDLDIEVELEREKEIKIKGETNEKKNCKSFETLKIPLSNQGYRLQKQ